MLKKLFSFILLVVACVFSACDEPVQPFPTQLYIYSPNAHVKVIYYNEVAGKGTVLETAIEEISGTTKKVGGVACRFASEYKKHPEYGTMKVQLLNEKEYAIITACPYVYVNGEFTYVGGNSTYSAEQIMEALLNLEGNVAIKISDTEEHEVLGECAWSYQGKTVNYGKGNLPEIKL